MKNFLNCDSAFKIKTKILEDFSYQKLPLVINVNKIVNYFNIKLKILLTMVSF